MSRPAPDMQQLYRDLILDHSRSPRHFGCLDDATHVADGINPLCGDKLRLYLRVDGNGSIADSSFEGSGCAISVASASMLTDVVIGETVATADRWVEEITSMLDGSTTEGTLSPGLESFAALQGVREFPGRVKCATLSWHALDAALNRQAAPASTE